MGGDDIKGPNIRQAGAQDAIHLKSLGIFLFFISC